MGPVGIDLSNMVCSFVIQDLREISVEVATAVALAAQKGGVAEKSGLPADQASMREFVRQAMWAPNPDATE